MKKPFAAPSECPVCGDAVPRNARSCPNCGACEKSGWNEADDDDSFDYESFVAEEFGAGKRAPTRAWFWRAVAAAVLIGFLWLLVSGIF